MSNNCSCVNSYNSPVFPSQVNLGMTVTSGLRPGRAIIDNLTVAARLGLVKPAPATSPPFASAQISGTDQTLGPPVNRVHVGQKRVSGYQTISSLRIVNGGSGYTDSKNVSTVVADGLDAGIPKPSVIKTFLASSINPDAPDPQPTPPANPQNQTKPPPSNQMRKYRTKVGKGLTVDITTSAGKIIAATINNPGFGYEAGSEIIVNSGNLDAKLVIGLSSWVKGGQQVSQNSQSVAENINLATGARGGPVENYSNMRGSMISKTSNFVNTSHLEIPGRAISSAAASSTVIKPTFAGTKDYEVEKNENTYAPCPINVARGFTYKKKEIVLPSGDIIEQNIPGKIIRAKFADPSANTFSKIKVTGGVASFFVLSGGNGYEDGKLYRTNAQIETIDTKTYSSQGQSLEIRSRVDPTTALAGGIIINPGNNYRVGDQLLVEIPINEKTNRLTTAGVPIFAAPAVPTTSAVIQITSLSRDCVNQLQRNINTNNTLFAAFTSSYV